MLNSSVIPDPPDRNWILLGPLTIALSKLRLPSITSLTEVLGFIPNNM